MITREDMAARFGEQELAQLTDRDRYQTVNGGILDKAIADATAEAAAYLNAAQIALSPVPPVLVAKVCDIARYYLYDDAVTEIVEARYKQAVAWLREVMRYPNMLDPTRAAADKQPTRCAVKPADPPADWPDTMGKGF